MGIRQRREQKNEADKLMALGEMAKADLAVAAEATKDVPKPEPEPEVEPIPEAVKEERLVNARNHFPDGFPGALYENRRHNQRQIDKLEYEIARLSHQMQNRELDHKTYLRYERKRDDLDKQLDGFLATMHPVGFDGTPLLVQCRIRDCPEYHTATSSGERGGRCSLCFAAALRGERREFVREVPPPVSY
jgi:hypothetical protein